MAKKASNVELIKKKNKSLTIGLAALLCIQFGAVLYTSMTVSRQTKASAISYGETIAENQMLAINEYIDRQAERLTDYSNAPEVKNLLKLESSTHTSDTEFNKQYSLAQNTVQKYIEQVSNTREEDGNDEGIYVANTNSNVLAHTYKENIGITTREGESLTMLINMIHSAGAGGKNEVYNAGIILSPVGNHEQIISMYKGIFDDNDPNVLLGYVGMGVYVDDIENDLNLEISELPSLKYSMVHIDDKGNDTWLFNEENPDIVKITSKDDAQVAEYKPIDNKYIKDFCSQYRKNPDNIKITDFYENEENNTINIIAFSKTYDMLLNLSVDKNELYNVSIRTGYATSFSMILTLILGILVFIINQVMLGAANKLNKAVKKQENTVAALNASIDEDLLTGVKSRGAFYSFIDAYNMNGLRYTDMKLESDETYFFVLHSINDILQYNSELGEESSDDLLSNIAEELIQFYGKENIFRTGSKEFVCIKKDKKTNAGSVLARVTGMHNSLAQPHKLFDGSVIAPVVDTAMIKQANGLNVHIITELKNLAVSNRPITSAIPVIDKFD